MPELETAGGVELQENADNMVRIEMP